MLTSFISRTPLASKFTHTRIMPSLCWSHHVLQHYNRQNCDPSTSFSFPNYKFSRGHPLKISVPLTKLNTRKFIFAYHPSLEFFARNNCYSPIHILFQTPFTSHKISQNFLFFFPLFRRSQSYTLVTLQLNNSFDYILKSINLIITLHICITT